MAKLALSILGFSLLLNIATGMLFHLIPAFEDNIAISGKYSYDEDGSSLFNDGLKKEVKPAGGDVEDKGSVIYRVLDMLQIGFLFKLWNFIETYLYGFINLLGIIMNGLLDDSMWSFLFGSSGAFYIIMTMIYITTGISAMTKLDMSGRN